MYFGILAAGLTDLASGLGRATMSSSHKRWPTYTEFITLRSKHLVNLWKSYLFYKQISAEVFLIVLYLYFLKTLS